MAAAQALEILAALERRYDGPIPSPLRRLARRDSIPRRRLMTAESQADFFTRLIGDQLAALRHERRTGTILASLLQDLALYRRRRCWWRHEAARLRGT